jgi:hypothetical protein
MMYAKGENSTMGSSAEGKDMNPPAPTGHILNEAKPLHLVPRTADPALHDQSHGSKVRGAKARS